MGSGHARQDFIEGFLRGQLLLAAAIFPVLVLAVAGWVLGRWPAKWPSGIAAVLLIVLAIAIPASQRKNAHRTSAETATAATAAPNGSGPLSWQPYSEQAVDTARSAGHQCHLS